MSGVGKAIRWGRFFHERLRFGVIVPIDHGLTLGPLDGIESISKIASWIRHPVITGTIAHKGIVERLAMRGHVRKLGMIMHLTGANAGSANPNQKEWLSSIETAVKFGVDAVSLQTNFDGENDAHNLKLMGAIVDEAARYGLPVLAMIYDVHPQKQSLARLHHLIRIAVELGVDAVKIAPPSTVGELAKLLELMAADVDIFIAGGALQQDDVLLELADAAVRYGAAGLCVGRNVFQRGAPSAVLERLGQRIFAVTGLAMPASRPSSIIDRDSASRVGTSATRAPFLEDVNLP